MKILLISVIGLAVGWLLCYGAMKTAEQIARNTQTELSE